jgi:hypothetical protein
MPYGTGILEREIRGRRVKIDGRKATLSATVPETETHEDYGRTEEIVYTNPIELLRGRALPSFSLIRFGKVKNVIDGIYAAVEERIAETGHGLSREKFIKDLEPLVSGDAKKYLTAARLRQTSDDPAMTIPQGFYDWTSKLREAYKQIKILARRPGFFVGRENDRQLNAGVITGLREAIQHSPALKETYKQLEAIYSRMTGKPEGVAALFPPAQLPDQELFKELSSEMQSDLPEGLGKLLVEAVKKRRVNFTPDTNSGLYIRQMFEIVPLVLRDSEEFKKFLVNAKYAKILENEFISQWVGTRHTHVGHSHFEDMLLGCSADHETPIVIQPELAVEPFATSYERMRDSLAFLGETIRTYLPEVLGRRRLMHDGSRASISIDEELEETKLLLEGLSLVSKDSIHLQYQNSGAKTAVETALKWLGNVQNDPDLNRNMAIFVPIIRTTNGSRQISYINAGFKTIDVDLEYQDEPTIEIAGQKGRLGTRYEFEGVRYQLPVLVHREVRVPYEKLMNDRKLREMLNGSFTEAELDKAVKKLEAGI